jgi:glycosyltransferase involved in cell wall biosynthesis
MKDRFLIVSPPRSEICGWSTHANSIIDNLRILGLSAHIQPIQPQQPTLLDKVRFVSRGSFKWYVIFLDALKSLSYFLYYRPSVVIVIVEPLACAYSLLRYIFKFKLVLFCAGTYALKLASSRSWLHVLPFIRSDAILSVSEYTKRCIINYQPGSRITVLPLGYEPSSFYRDPLIKKNKGQILFVGNAKRRKGLNVLLDALSLLSDTELSTISLFIVGKFSANDISLLTTSRKLLFNSCNISFVGSVSDERLRFMYQTSIVHIIPSINDNGAFEGFGLPHIDSIACGTLSIGSLDCGNETAIQVGNGFLVEQNSSFHLSLAIRTVLSLEDPVPLGPLPSTWCEHVISILYYISNSCLMP